MSITMLAALTLLAAAACGRGEKRDVASADSLSRDLQLAPVDTTAELNDRPSADTAAATPVTPAPEPKPRRPAAQAGRAQPKPAPAPAASPVPTAATTPGPAPTPAARGLEAGASFSATTDAEIRSNKNRVGDEVTATVAADVKNSAGQVVIPAGSKVTLQVTAIKESENKGDSTARSPSSRPHLDQREVGAAAGLDLGRQDLPAGPGHQRGRHCQGRRRDGRRCGRGPGDRWQHQGRDHRRHHRRRGRHPAGGRDQGP